MAQFELNFNALPDNAYSNPQPGRHKLTIKEAKVVNSGTGSLMLQLSHYVDDSKQTINFDNYVIVKADGTPSDFGQAKLKHLLTAIGVTPQGKFTLTMLPPAITGKSFYADLDFTDSEKKYLGIKGLDSYAPVSPVATAQAPAKPASEVVQGQLQMALDEEI